LNWAKTLVKGIKSIDPKRPNWAKTLVKGIKSIDPKRPVGVGDGNWNVFGGNNGFDIQSLSKIVDFLGPHMYVPEIDYYRHSMVTEFMIRFLKNFGLPGSPNL